jgi:hypothetical protein
VPSAKTNRIESLLGVTQCRVMKETVVVERVERFNFSHKQNSEFKRTTAKSHLVTMRTAGVCVYNVSIASETLVPCLRQSLLLLVKSLSMAWTCERHVFEMTACTAREVDMEEGKSASSLKQMLRGIGVQAPIVKHCITMPVAKCSFRQLPAI